MTNAQAEWIDTHLHLLDLQRFRYDWVAGLPALQRSFGLEEYQRQARACGITHTLHMEVDVQEAQMLDETRHIAQLMREPGSVLVGALAACRPEREDFATQLEQYQNLPHVKGLRRILHTSADELSQGETFRRNLRLLGQTNYPFDLCVLARQLPVALDLVRACPQVTFVLNHCGVPDVAGQGLAPYREHIRALAQLPNVNCKISGVIAYGDAKRWGAAAQQDASSIAQDLRPFVEHCIESFGWQRVVWGSDWPVCTLTSNLGTWMAVTQELLRGVAADDVHKLASRNARRIYHLS